MMSQEEIFELAEQDALGLLDEQQRNRFESALSSADAHVLTAVRRRQDEICSIHLVTPGPEASPTLRDKVLARVEALIAEEAVASAQDATLARIESLAAKNDWFERIVAGRVSPAWRVAALVAFTTAIAFGGLAYRTQIANNQLSSAFVRNDWSDFVRQSLGADAKDFLQPGALSVALTSQQPKLSAWGRMMSIPGHDRGLLYVTGLPKSSIDYQVQVMLPGDEAPRTVASFSGDGSDTALRVDLNGIDPNKAQWFVMGPKAGDGSELVCILSSDAVG